MPINKIIDADAVRARLKLADLADVNDAINSALTAASLFMQGILDTPFEEATGLVEVFHPTEDEFPVVKDGLFRLRLRRGFVSSVVSVKIADDRTEVASGDTLTEGDDYVVRADKGLVLLDEEHAGKWVQVSYEAGFADGSAPEWLAEAALTYIGPILNVTNVENHEEIAQKQMKDTIAVVSTMLQPYMRGAAFQFRPVY
jgi:hypothetical protein